MLASRTLLAVPCVVLSGCSYALRPPVVEAGQPFFDSRVNEVKYGATADQVRAVLGEPYESQGNENAGRWRYYMRLRAAEGKRLLGVIPIPDDTTRNDYEAVITWRDGRVDEVSSHRRRVQ
jgi:outer membrane protein assembly factor BamE (lipoprotein component of BamABCDE complex)